MTLVLHEVISQMAVNSRILRHSLLFLLVSLFANLQSHFLFRLCDPLTHKFGSLTCIPFLKRINKKGTLNMVCSKTSDIPSSSLDSL
jgi:hypothetical protein